MYNPNSFVPIGQMVESRLTNIPKVCNIGKMWTESTMFDDKLEAQCLQGPIKLCSIVVSSTDKYIQGIGFKYKSTVDGKVIETRHNLCANTLTKFLYAVTEREFLIDDNDYLKSIKGRYGDWIDRLEFVTYNGKNQNYGGKGGQCEFSLDFPGYTFDLVSGGFRSFIDFLNISVSPLPDHFQQKVNNTAYSSGIQYPPGYAPQLPQAIPYQMEQSGFTIINLPGQPAPLPQYLQVNQPFVQSYVEPIRQPNINPQQSSQYPPQQYQPAQQFPQQQPSPQPLNQSNYNYPHE